MAFEKVEVIQGEEINPETIVAKIREMLDETAKLQLDEAVEGVKRWIGFRLKSTQRLLKGDQIIDQVELGLNAYNRSLGLGIQSVAISLRAGEHVLLGDNEYQDPTVGFIANGLLGDNVKSAVVGFPVNEGNTEVVMAATDGLMLDSSSAEELYNGEVGIALQGEAVHIDGPENARTILEVAAEVSLDPKAIRAEIHNAGVYICEYIRTSNDVAADSAVQTEAA